MKCDVCNGSGYVENERYISTVVLKPMNVVSNHRINVSDVVVVVFLLAILMKLLIS